MRFHATDASATFRGAARLADEIAVTPRTHGEPRADPPHAGREAAPLGRSSPSHPRTHRAARPCVTGGAGFLGRCVAARLPGCFVPRRADYDLTRERDVERLYADARPDVIVHLAAECGGIGANLSQPGRFFYANLAMGMHVIEHARRSGVRKLVMVGTVCAYPKHAPAPFRESSLWDGYPEETNAPYGVAKRALLTMCQAYRQQYGLSAVYLMPANLYGPGDNDDPHTSHVIPAMIRSMLAARDDGAASVTLWGDGSPTRDFLYVEDAADAIVAALQRYDDPGPLNLGTGRETSMRELAALVADLVGYTGRIEWDGTMPNGQPRRVLDTSRAAACLGWRATTTLEEGLRKAIEWYTVRRGAGAAPEVAKSGALGIGGAARLVSGR